MCVYYVSEFKCVCVCVCVYACLSFGNVITPVQTEMFRDERESVTLSCTYETNSNDIWLYWYRQYPNREPEYVLYKGARSSQSSDEDIPDGFQSTTSQSSTELIINSVTLSDSALYYCALRVAAQ
ncbi:hypothetical protein PO909_031122 [Leuciscus waleckii]